MSRVITLCTVTKSLAPAIRLGWILCPPSFTDTIAQEKQLADRGSPLLDQVILATLIQSGRYDRHLRRMRQSYGQRRQALQTALTSQAPTMRLTGLAAGFHAVAHLPAHVPEPTRRHNSYSASVIYPRAPSTPASPPSPTY